VEPLLRILATMLEQFARLTKQVLDLIRQEPVYRRLMSVPGVGPTTELPLWTIERSIGETPPSVFPGHAPGRPKHRKLGNFQTADLGSFTPASTAAAEQALTAFEASFWGQRYPAIRQSWRRAWPEIIPFFAFPDDVRRIVYTTNSIEALNAKLRRAVRARGHFPTDEAATKLLYLILNRSEKEWKMPPREWAMAKAQFAVLFGERFEKAAA